MDHITMEAGKLRFHGSVAQKLAASGMNVNALRDNTLLRKEEWLSLDQAIVDVARQRLNAVGALLDNGQRLDLANGLGTTVLQWEEQSDLDAASISMDAVTRAQKDRLAFDLVSVPLPITHVDFDISLRTLEASRKQGIPLDTSTARVAARKVAESIEQTLLTGASSLTFGGGTLYGYTDYPTRNTVNLTATWDSSGAAGLAILDDIRAMLTAAHADRMFGPYELLVPTEYWTVLSDDYSAQYPKTILSRILETPGITNVRPCDLLTADNVLLIQMDSSTVDMIVGLQPTVVSWESQGGMLMNFKVMAIMVPRIKNDFDGRSGVIHLS